MYDSPAYVWAIIIAGPTAIAAATCIALYGGAKRAGLGRRRAALLAGATAGLLGGWFTASAVIAGHGWYHTLPMARPSRRRTPCSATAIQPTFHTRLPRLTAVILSPFRISTVMRGFCVGDMSLT